MISIQVFEQLITAELLLISQTIANASDGTPLELHFIAGQGARLVAEHILDLSELLIQIGGARHRIEVALRVIHLLVPVDEVRLQELDKLERHLQADRYQVVVQNYEGDEGEGKAGAAEVGHLLEAEVPVPLLVLAVPVDIY